MGISAAWQKEKIRFCALFRIVLHVRLLCFRVVRFCVFLKYKSILCPGLQSRLFNTFRDFV